MNWNFSDLVIACGFKITHISNASEEPGYYMLFDEQGEFIYVGKADKLKTRLAQHFGDAEENEFIKGIAKYAMWWPTPTVSDAEDAEGVLYDSWFNNTGTLPRANKIRPPKSNVSDADIEKGKFEAIKSKLQKLFLTYGTLAKKFPPQ